MKPKEPVKTRVIKAQDVGIPLKSGVIALTDGKGKTVYKVPCDHCDATAQTYREPRINVLVLCPVCKKVDLYGRPETEVTYEKGRPVYRTPCDQCGRVSVSKFFPHRDKPFYCMRCKHQLRQEALAPAPEQATPEAPPNPESHAPSESMTSDAPVLSGPAGADAASPQATPQEPQRYSVPCAKCAKVLELGFRPKAGEEIVCPSCYGKEQQRKRQKESGPRVIYKVECVSCGKVEMLDRVPRRPDQALCRSCYRTRQEKLGFSEKPPLRKRERKN